MSTDADRWLASLRFDGRRFDSHALDVECTQELLAYRELVLECAKELWKRGHSDRARLPKKFEGGFQLEFDRVGEGSTLIPLRRVRTELQGSLELDDEFNDAALLIDAAITAADNDDLLPESLPSNVIPLFRNFGRTLAQDEVLFLRARGSAQEAPYSSRARARLADWVGPTYEDAVNVVGEVRMAHIGPGTFKLQVDGGGMVDGRFNAGQEALVLDALRNHESVRLRVEGTAEFSVRDRQVKRLLVIRGIGLALADAQTYDETVQPIWEQLVKIGAEAPDDAWKAVPDDLSMRIDEVVYGKGGDR